MIIYITVAVGGFYTCGDKCPEIIINRDPLPDSKDYLMNFCKVMLLVCLVVGIILRNQSNKAGIFGILEEFKKINEDVAPSMQINSDYSNTEGRASIETEGIPNASATGKLSDEIRRASSQVL